MSDSGQKIGAGLDELEKRTGTGRTAWIIGAVVLVIVLIVGGVIWFSSSSDGADGADGENATVDVAQTLEPDNLDIRHTSGAALDQILIDNVYEGLLKRTPDGDVEPGLASYEANDEGTEYEFTIDQGVKFHDGSDLTVDDAVWSLQQVVDDETITAHPELADIVSSIEKQDEDSFVVTLNEPDSNFLWNLSGRAGLVLKKDADNDLATTENGTGPYRIPEGGWRQGDRIVLERFDDYWGDPVQVSTVNVIYQTDQAAQVNALNSGEVDVAAVDADSIDQFEGSDDWQVTENTTTSVATLAYNNERAPLNDVRVRRALSQAIDKDAINEAQGGRQEVTGSPIASDDPGFEDLTDVNSYDPESARRLLEEAGHGDGLDLSLVIPNIYSSSIIDVLTSDLEEVGVNLDVEQVEFASWLQTVQKDKNYDLSFVLHAESRDFANYANPDYYFGYDNEEVQDLYTDSVRTADLDEADEKLRQAARIVADDAAADWLFNVVSTSVVRSGVEGWPEGDTISRLDLTDLAVTSE